MRTGGSESSNLLDINDGDSKEMKIAKKLARKFVKDHHAQNAADETTAKTGAPSNDKKRYRRANLKKLCPAAHVAVTQVITKLLEQGVKFLVQIKNYHVFSMKKQTLCGLIISEIKKVTHSADPTIYDSWEGYWEIQLLDSVVYAFGQKTNRTLQKMRKKVTGRYILCCVHAYDNKNQDVLTMLSSHLLFL